MVRLRESPRFPAIHSATHLNAFAIVTRNFNVCAAAATHFKFFGALVPLYLQKFLQSRLSLYVRFYLHYKSRIVILLKYVRSE